MIDIPDRHAAYRRQRPAWAAGLPLLLTAALTAGAIATSKATSGTDGAEMLRMPKAWKTITVPTRLATEFSFTSEGEVAVTAANSVAFLYMKAGSTIQPATAEWRWRVDDNIPPTDLAIKGGDDRPVAVHFWFDTGDHTDTMFGSVAELFGYPVLTHTLTYVWGGVRSEGSLLGNPYFPNGALFILKDQNAQLGRWYDESRNLAADLRQAFGDTVGLEHLRYVAISGDTDDTATQSQARVAALRLIYETDTR